MSRLQRFAYQADKNQQPIVDALEAAGALVEQLDRNGDGIPDLLVGINGRLVLLEVKNPSTHKHRSPTRALRDGQRDFFRKWRGFPVFVVFTPQQALRAIGAA